jgi:hexosaminidase
VPGHVGAILLAMPELNVAAAPREPVEEWGIFDYVLDPKEEGSFALVAELIKQVRDVFVDDVFHLGGDEVLWGATLDQSRDWMIANNVSDLYQYFVRRAVALVKREGKTPMGWQEVRDCFLGFDRFELF